MSANTSLECNDTRKCFAKNGATGRCRILVKGERGVPYADGECPFCKPRANVTNGKVYPYSPYYLTK